MSEFGDILGPPPHGGMRVVFLYVGQGESTLVFIPNGDEGHISVLVDCNRAPKLGGIDLGKLLQHALRLNSAKRPQLDVFINTHPHADHLGGLAELREAIDIGEVWHSGHKPGPDGEAGYKELEALMATVTEEGGKVVKMFGSREALKLGDAHVNVVSPAKYVSDDIDHEKSDVRRKRIHEQCAVLRISIGSEPSSHGVLITGDSDRTAWEEHITDYHGKEEDNRVAAMVMSASHHGSYTFFRQKREDEGEESYTKHLERIGPTDIIISAPDPEDSQFDHPHKEALDLYEKHVDKDGIHHMGSRGWSLIADFEANGSYDVRNDNGELKETYGLDLPDDGDGNGGQKKGAPTVISQVENSRPMG